MASSNNPAMERYKNAITAVASVAGAAKLLSRLVADEFDGAFYNRVFLAAKAYVSILLAAAPVPLMKASVPRGAGAGHITLAMRPGTAVVDLFDEAEVTWRLSNHGGRRRDAGADDAREVFTLSFHGQHKDMVLGAYLPAAGRHGPRRGQVPGAESGQALQQREYYERTGRAWKRRYLIHGPAGSGKSSLVAAISEPLRFDVYDLDLGGVRSNTELRKLLIRMKSSTHKKTICLLPPESGLRDDVGGRPPPRRTSSRASPSGSSSTSAMQVRLPVDVTTSCPDNLCNITYARFSTSFFRRDHGDDRSLNNGIRTEYISPVTSK
ncbi:hypothetical protein GUJ93_ZPchr0007g4336 [Zizania palustris]|uniref:AAA-type ATPase N-terminal domain-containing protein n=1 Tax=Zizania palustris TaxID=103762 RepID=A0A8J5SNX9_ZIZPA|nr:hypothetical protein GUJ93_ZPchr0007g4336 [Zizania palustris]